MDKIKAFGAKMWKQRFWVLTGTVSLLGVIFLFAVTSSLQGVTNKRNSKIISAVVDLDRLLGIPNHPNEDFHKAQEALNERLTTAVEHAWQLKWEDQTKGTPTHPAILTWPEKLDSDFLRRVEPLRPIERKLPLVPDQFWREPLTVRLRQRYALYISEELPYLTEIVRGTKWPVASDTDHTQFRDEEDLGIVHWDPANQQEIEQAYFQWPHRKNDLPTTLDVLYAQEDLWVLKALTQIIAVTNRGSDARHNLIIKDINFIQIGRLAGVPAGDILFLEPKEEGETSPGTGGEGSGAFGAQLEFGSIPGSETMGTGAGREGAPGGVGPDHPAEGRYVDKNYLPLPAEQLWNAGESNEAETAYLAVAKRMPIRIGVTMDQREINRLLIACGNSPLTVEVRQVRINPGSSGRSADAVNRGIRGREIPGGVRELGQGGDSNDNSGLGPYDVRVEIYGIIYIFNPVDGKKLRPNDIDSEGDVQADAPPEESSTDQNPVPVESDE